MVVIKFMPIFAKLLTAVVQSIGFFWTRCALVVDLNTQHIWLCLLLSVDIYSHRTTTNKKIMISVQVKNC